MKKIAALALLGAFSFLSCGKNDSGCQPIPVESEKSQLVTYATNNGINYTFNSSGFLYQIIDTGRGTVPTSTSVITVSYVGKRLTNVVFDSSASYTNNLNLLIDGWKQGLPLIKKGGRIKLIIPSAPAYSCLGAKNNYGTFVIDPNEPLYFDLTLLDVQ